MERTQGSVPLDPARSHASGAVPASDPFGRLVSRVDRAIAGSHFLRVLTYHRVDVPGRRPELSPGLISALPDEFERQMRFLARSYRVVSAAEVLHAAREGIELPPRAVLLTFDDAYRDFAENAWPALRKYGLPVTLFVPTAYPGDPKRAFWWDRLYHAVVETGGRDVLESPLGRLPLASRADRAAAYGRLNDHVKSLPHQEAMEFVQSVCETFRAPSAGSQVLDWDALRTLAREGVTLGAHTRTHPLLNRVTAAEAREEAVGSLRDLEREIGPTLPVLACPGGGIDDGVAAMLRDEGFALVFTTETGGNDLRTADPMRLRRYNVGRRTTLPVLRVRLSPLNALRARLS